MALACSSISLAGTNLDCSPSIGGIKTVYLAKYSDIASVTVSSADATKGKITAITLETGGRWYEYQFRKNTGSLTSTLNVDDASGAVYVTNELALVFSKMETAKRLEMSALSLGQLAAVVEDSNGCFWYLGLDDYVSASAGTGETGTAKGDRNAYTLTLSTDSLDWPLELSSEAVTAVETSAHPTQL